MRQRRKLILPAPSEPFDEILPGNRSRKQEAAGADCVTNGVSHGPRAFRVRAKVLYCVQARNYSAFPLPKASGDIMALLRLG